MPTLAEIPSHFQDPLVIKELVDMVVSGAKTAPKVSLIMNFPKETEEKIHHLAIDLYELGRYQEAEKLFDKLVTLDVLNPKYLWGSAACAHQQKQFFRAFTFYAFVSAVDENNLKADFYCAECSLELGNKNAAIIFYEKAFQKIGEQASEELLPIKARCEAMLLLLKQK